MFPFLCRYRSRRSPSVSRSPRRYNSRRYSPSPAGDRSPAVPSRSISPAPKSRSRSASRSSRDSPPPKPTGKARSRSRSSSSSRSSGGNRGGLVNYDDGSPDRWIFGPTFKIVSEASTHLMVVILFCVRLHIYRRIRVLGMWIFMLVLWLYRWGTIFDTRMFCYVACDGFGYFAENDICFVVVV